MDYDDSDSAITATRSVLLRHFEYTTQPNTTLRQIVTHLQDQKADKQQGRESTQAMHLMSNLFEPRSTRTALRAQQPQQYSWIQ